MNKNGGVNDKVYYIRLIAIASHLVKKNNHALKGEIMKHVL